MTVQRGIHPSADALNAFGPVIVSKRSRLTLRLAALVAAIAVLTAAGTLELPPLAAYPPPKAPSPQEVQRQMMEHARHLAEHHHKMLHEALKQQQIRQQHENKLQQEYQKQLHKHLQEHQKHHLEMQKHLEEHLKHHPPGTKPPTPPPGTKAPTHPPGKKPVLPAPRSITVKQLPARGQVFRSLKMALRQVHAAATFPPEPRQMAMISISQALMELGEPAPMPPAPLAQKGDHIRWAKEDLQTAHKEVINARHLPSHVKIPVLAEIHKALHFLSFPEWPYPNMEPARKQLIEALHQVHAATRLEGRARAMALHNIREALHVLGVPAPDPVAPIRIGDHIRLAEEHLHRAYRDVVEARHLPPEQRMPVLWEIHNAMFALRHPAEKFPDLKEAKDQLVYALHQVHAASIRDDLKVLALTNIGEAIRVLGENPPRAWPHYEKRDHLREAEMHLRKAREDVEGKKLLPLREFVLEKIAVADVALKEAGNPIKPLAATK